VSDDLVNEGGIMDLWVREARLFKYGSGTGTNFSKLRGENEPLAGGGKSSGLMSWLRIGDRAAGAIKSGGTTRRAAKMVCLDMDHPDIEQFINWKVREELKVAALVEGLKNLGAGDKATAERLGLKLDYDFNGEAYGTVSGQNSNNSVRIPDAFFEAVDADADWKLFNRVSGDVAEVVKARHLWHEIGYAAWRCADPGVQYDSTINAWHTCPESGRINASNPCSEYMFLDNTACNLASINLLKFYDSKSRAFDIERYEHAIDLWTVVLEISVLMAAFPSKEIAQLSYDADAGRRSVRLRGRARDLRRADLDHVRSFVPPVGGNGQGTRRVPRVHEEPEPHASRDAQPPARRARRRSKRGR
jgi:ribonucleoside-diphosphate reductase alpha chain